MSVLFSRGRGKRPDGLKTLDMAGLVEFIKSGRCSNIAFLTGAGMSVAAGIPDFRSPGGMYDTLQPDLLTATEQQRSAMAREPTTVVSWELFQRNPLPYLELRRPFILGLANKKWKATLSHFFVNCCHDRGLLQRLYTQNIDGLDFQTDIPSDKIVSVHGTMGTVSCEMCGHGVPLPQFCMSVQANVRDIYGRDPASPVESKPVLCESCGEAAVKPDTVLYGRALPEAFFDCRDEDMAHVDVLIVAGTSLTVSPANSLVSCVPDSCVRVIANMEAVGSELGVDYSAASERDIFLCGSCDEVLLRLSEELGWADDLRAFRDRMAEASVELMDGAACGK